MRFHVTIALLIEAESEEEAREIMHAVEREAESRNVWSGSSSLLRLTDDA